MVRPQAVAPNLEKLLAELVAVDSTSTLPNAPVLDVLEPRLKALGLTTERHRYRDEQGVEKANLIATNGGGHPELALVGHSDCVPYDKTWAEALTLTERDGKLYGRGSCDTKAFVACTVTALERTKGRLSKPLLVCFTADEEVGCYGAKQLVGAGKARSRRCIIGEPTSLVPIRGNKGYCLAELEFRGKEGHSAYPESGASAIFRAARFLTRLEAYALGELRTVGDPRFEPPFTTVNTGVIAGGKAKNIIPGECRVTLEWRPIPSQPVEHVLTALKGIEAACRAEDPGFSLTVKPLRMDRGFETAAEAEVVKFLEVESGNPSSTVAFGTEGPQMTELGSVPVVFGPGDIKNAHQTGEFVPKAELHRCAEVLERALLKFCA
ncbi:MAG: acetylornithine deacetylase [Myxococcaceae bacterium]|nr:acetylornithine deacetylase [Myxococcaceae bacterium]